MSGRLRTLILWQVYVVNDKFGSFVWRYPARDAAEIQYEHCRSDRKNKIVELQSVTVFKSSYRPSGGQLSEHLNEGTIR